MKRSYDISFILIAIFVLVCLANLYFLIQPKDKVQEIPLSSEFGQDKIIHYGFGQNIPSPKELGIVSKISTNCYGKGDIFIVFVNLIKKDHQKFLQLADILLQQRKAKNFIAIDMSGVEQLHKSLAVNNIHLVYDTDVKIAQTLGISSRRGAIFVTDENGMIKFFTAFLLNTSLMKQLITKYGKGE